MAKFTEEKIHGIFAPHLHEGEVVQNVAFGVKQPPIILIILLIFLAVLPGIIASVLLTKNYLIATTNKRFIVLHIKGFSNADLKGMIEYNLSELNAGNVKTSTGGIFTHIQVTLPDRPFVAKFHRAYSKFNRPGAMAICETITGGQAA